MECSIYCQICCTTFVRIYCFKQHLSSEKHRLMTQDVFPKATMCFTGLIPEIVFMHPKKRLDLNQPVVGLSVITLCFSPIPALDFYLCHLCETKCNNILGHIFSQEHCFNYCVYTNPDDVSFSWRPDMDMKGILGYKLKRESSKPENQNLQVLHLPQVLLETTKSSTYSEVMQALGENDKLVERFEAMHQRRVTLQDYNSNNYRKHPLLGLQHIVECASVKPGEKKYNLCTLCCLVIPNHMIIKHILSFDHISCYFKTWYPSTLISKPCKDYDTFDNLILDFANQAVKLQAAEHFSMKQVSLQPDEFKLVNFKSYPQALNSLESITKSSLTISVKPGKKLEHHPVSTLSTEKVKCLLRCQNCSNDFNTIGQYLNHLVKVRHIEMMQKFNGEDMRGHRYGQRGRFHMELYTYIGDSLRSNQPPIGTALIVTCITSCSHADPLYLCFACNEAFPQSILRDHVDSRKHLISTQTYQNPWKLPFGWDGDLDDKVLRMTAWKDEEEHRRNRVFLKVFDVPYSIFLRLDPSDFQQVLDTLGHHCLIHKVPMWKTHTELQQNKTFPLLGLQFLIAHKLMVRPNKLVVGFLCLLCERRLFKEETEAHVFSREHVSKFLDCFHPGSLNSFTVDTETLLDLAKQAAQVHPVSNVQEIDLDKPIWEPCTYKKAKMILSAANWRKGNGQCFPTIKPMRKLVPRIPPKDAKKHHETGSQKSCPVIDTKDVQNKKQRSEKETSSRETKVAGEKEESQKMCPEDLKNEGETDLPVTLKTEESMIEKPKEVAQSHEHTEKNNDALTEQEGSSSIEQETTQLKDYQQKSETENGSSTSEKSPNETSQNGGKMSPKRQPLTSKEDLCSKESTEISTNCKKVENTDTTDGEEKHKEVMDRVLKTCVEWRCGELESIFLCGHCLLKIPKKDINSHLEGAHHPKMCRLVVHLEEEMYGQISNKSFQSASLQDFLYKVIQKTVRPDHWFNSGSSLRSSAQACVTPNVSAAPRSKQKVKEKVVYNSEEGGAAPDASEMTAAKCRPDHGTSSDTENAHTCSPASRSNKEPTEEKNNAGSCSQSTKNKCKADVFPNKNRSLRIKAATKSEELGAVLSTCSTNKSTTSSHRLTETASATSKTSTPTSPTSSMSPRSKSVTASEKACNTAPSSDTGSTGTHKPERPSKCAKTESRGPTVPETRRTSSATSKTAKSQVKNMNTEASAKILTGANPDPETAAHKRKLPDVPQKYPEEIKKPRKDPPHVPPNKTTLSGNLPKVGLNQLIVVSCERKQQVYCLLCSVKLNLSSQFHLTSSVHQYKYVKMKYPEWSSKELEKQLNHAVPLLAEVEKTLPHTRSAQKLEVEKNEYQKLGILADSLAVERVKALVKQRDQQASSSPTVDSSEHPCHDVSSPCDISSSGIPAFNEEMSDYADINQPEQENKHQQQPSLDQVSDMECIYEDPTVAAGQSVGGKSLDEEDMQVDDGIRDEPDTFLKTDPQQLLDQWMEAEDLAESETILKSAEKVRAADSWRHQGSCGEDADDHNLIQDHRQSMSCNEINQDPSSKSEDVAETPLLHQFKAHDNRSYRKTLLKDDMEQQHWESNPASQESQKAVECAKKVSSEKVSSFGMEVAAGQQNQAGLSHKGEPAPKLCTQFEEHSASKLKSTTSLGRKARESSRLSIYLKASRQDLGQVTGMDSVWECQGIRLKTFFLCEICEKMLSTQDICQHMVSLDHQLRYLRREDPRFLEMFWLKDDLPSDFKMVVLKEVVQELSKREQFHKVDAQCILLGSELHEFVRTSPFSEALEIVKNITNEDKQTFYLPTTAGHQKSEFHQNGQQTADLQSIQDCLPTETLSAQAPEKNQKSETAGQNPEKSHAKEASLTEGSNVVGSGRTSMMDVNSSSTKTDHVVFPDAIVGANVSHLEPCSTPAQQQEVKKAISQLKQNPCPMEVTSSNPKVYPVVPLSSTPGVDLHQEPCSSSLQSHYKSPVSQLEETISPLDLNASYSKANPVVPLGSLKPSQETCGGPPLQPEFKPAVSRLRRNSSSADVNSSNSVADLVSSCSVNPSQQTCSISTQHSQFTLAVPQLQSSDLAQVSESISNASPNLNESRRDKLPPTKARPADVLMETLFTTSSSLKDLMPAKCIPVPTTHETGSSFQSALVSSSVNPVKGERSSSLKALAPPDWKLVSNLISVLKQNNYSRSASNNAESRDSMKVSCPLGEPKDSASVPTADVSDPQRLQINVPQEVCRIVRNPEPNETGIGQLPIDTIITARSNHSKQTCKGQTRTDVNNHHLVSFLSDPTPSPTDYMAASGGGNPYTQAPYLPSGHLGSDLTQGHFPLSTVSIYQECIYPSQIYPEQAVNPVSLHSFGYSLTAQMPPVWGNMERQQYYSMMRRPQSDP
ncbi:uncharacterized protein LOC124879274 isoform X3 [Girardinichthys multiradiatus]|uniref:uncharacterized protein LOC124879274 isoform X3 n=1 Tax=Girardinichthys multiradiatus TaxID=208333 RepID=UPI001FAC65C5|nr:uncharacterized protein LOC124879274 isoform X3 [Girardinichthys multiradiatus]